MQNKTPANENIREAIMDVIAFFDVFSYPLTVIEVWQFLNIKISYASVLENLEVLKNNQTLSFKHGFYALPGRENLVCTRLERYNYSYEKFKKVKIIGRLFSYIPWIKLIAVGNSIGANNSRKESDIDLLIITEKNRLWVSRFLCVLIAKFLRQRPSKKTVKDKICLSFLISENMLDLKSLLLKNGHKEDDGGLKNFPDPYFLYWLACLQPIYDVDGTYEKLIQNNKWLKNNLPNWQEAEPVLINLKRKNNYFYANIIELFFGGLDKPLYRLQMRLFPPSIKDKLNMDTCVLANRQIIKLHSNDRREYFLSQYRERIKSLQTFE